MVVSDDRGRHHSPEASVGEFHGRTIPQTLRGLCPGSEAVQDF